MPTASDDLRDLMSLMFGSAIDEAGPVTFLQSRNYKLRDDWYWDLPAPDHPITEKEWLCIQFLCDEWDYGGIYEPEPDEPWPDEARP